MMKKSQVKFDILDSWCRYDLPVWFQMQYCSFKDGFHGLLLKM